MRPIILRTTLYYYNGVKIIHMKIKYLFLFVMVSIIFNYGEHCCIAASQAAQGVSSNQPPASSDQPPAYEQQSNMPNQQSESLDKEQSIKVKEYPASKDQTEAEMPLSTANWEIPSTYEIQRGDTLWDIAEKIYHSNFLWPKIWQFNPEIKNPDDIHTGQIIKLPTYSDNQESYNMPIPKELIIESKEKAKSGLNNDSRSIKIEHKIAVKHDIIPKVTSNVNEASLILQGGYIDKELKSYGHTMTNPEGKSILGTSDYIYVNTDIDDYHAYYIMRMEQQVTHPFSGQKLGYLINFEGILKITSKEYGYKKALIISCYDEIKENDTLVPFFTIEPTYRVSEKPFINGVIVLTKHSNYIGQFDIVYTDKGSSDGVVSGDIFTIYISEHSRQPIGKIKIISSQKTTSTAYVIKSSKEIKIGSVF